MGEQIKINTKKPLSTKENSAHHKQKTGFRSQSSHVDRILFLQRTIGNQAVQRMVRSGALQAKLRIGQPGDVYEQEADRVVDAVMRMPEPGVQRQVEPEEEKEEILQTKPLVDQITPVVQRQVEEEEMLQANSRENFTSEVTNDLESQINAIKGGGRPLAKSERAFFEPRFGADFSQVRVHTDAQAVETARDVNARAFTVNKDVVFGNEEYAPQTAKGKRLMAHELTHVVQQRNCVHLSGGGVVQANGQGQILLTIVQMEKVFYGWVRVIAAARRLSENNPDVISAALTKMATQVGAVNFERYVDGGGVVYVGPITYNETNTMPAEYEPMNVDPLGHLCHEMHVCARSLNTAAIKLSATLGQAERLTLMLKIPEGFKGILYQIAAGVMGIGAAVAHGLDYASKEVDPVGQAIEKATE